MSNLVLYAHQLSPPCRTVLMVAHAIGLKLKIHEINLLQGEHLTEKYAKINPERTIPTLDDNGFILPDSHAISCYLIEKYSDDDSLYPKDLQKRAMINRYLHFDSGVLFAAEKNAVKPILTKQEKTLCEKRLKNVNEAYQNLNAFLKNKKWLVKGDSYTLADISCATTASNATILVNMDDYPNVKAWLQRCEEELPGYNECNVPGFNEMHTVLQKLLQ